MHSFDLVLVVAQITSAPRWTHNQGSRIVCWRHELLGAIHKFEHLVEVKVVGWCLLHQSATGLKDRFYSLVRRRMKVKCFADVDVALTGDRELYSVDLAGLQYSSLQLLHVL
jgi:hypothetical protein